MRVLVWQWGRRGGGPRYAVELASGLAAQRAAVALSLSTGAEVLGAADAPACDLPVRTYHSAAGLAWRAAGSPWLVARLARAIAPLRPDLAICAMPGPLDLAMAHALRRCRVPFLVVVHDADAHPGDGAPLQMWLQRRLVRRSDGVIALSRHVGLRLLEQGLADGRSLLLSRHPPRAFVPAPPPVGTHGGPLRLLVFGRLLPYKGLDLLAAAMQQVGARTDLHLRIVGSGPLSPSLRELAALPNVAVENRWVPEDEVPALVAWADALVLAHTEASQSGGAAIAVAARRWVVATRVGGLPEQLEGEPMALLCDPSPGSLAAALRRLRDDPPPVCATPPADPFAALHADLAAFLRGRNVSRDSSLPSAPAPAAAPAPLGRPASPGR